MDKEDLLFSLDKMKRYIEQMDEDQFRMICAGQSVNTAMIPPKWDFYKEDFERRIVRLELRIR